MKKDSVQNITGSILSDLRKASGLTQKEFAVAFNVSEGTIAHYEQGVTIPNPEMLIKFADYFHVSVDYLLGRSKMKIDLSEFNNTFYKETKIYEVINLLLSFSKVKRRYILETINYMKSSSDKDSD